MSTDEHSPVLHNEVLTVREVATYLRVSRVTVWRWCQQGTIPALRVGRTWRIRRSDMMCLEHVPPDPNPDANTSIPHDGAT